MINITLHEMEKLPNMPLRELFSKIEAGEIGTPVTDTEVKASALGLRVVSGGKQ